MATVLGGHNPRRHGEKLIISPLLRRYMDDVWQRWKPEDVMDTEEVKRFRSFAERYIIERASKFGTENELDDVWECLLRAKTAYKMVHRVAVEFEDKPEDAQPQQAWGAPAQAQYSKNLQHAMSLQHAANQAAAVAAARRAGPGNPPPGTMLRVKLPEKSPAIWVRWWDSIIGKDDAL